MANKNLNNAKDAKNDEFYTQYNDIQAELNCYVSYNPDVFKDKTILLPCDDPEWSNFTKFFVKNFNRYGIKKLISTSYAPNSKPKDIPYQLTLFEEESENFDKDKTYSNGKIFILERDNIKPEEVLDVDALKWQYLEGDGDFRSDEIKKLRDEADVIITNPPFSLFREFFDWLIDSKKQFLVIGNLNAVKYRNVFSYIKNNKVWLGNNCNINGGAMFYEIPESIANLEQIREIKEKSDGTKIFITRVQGVRWFTNIEHGLRHKRIDLMTEEKNIKFSKHKEIKDIGYIHYNNYDGIDVPFIDAIPSDYKGAIGVPISIFDKYCPEQFEILGIGTGDHAKLLGIKKNYRGRTDLEYTINGIQKCPYERVLIKIKAE